MINLQTTRLIIRDHILDDINDYYALFSNKESMYYLPKSYLETIEDAQKQLDIAIHEINRDDRERYFFCIINKESGLYMGEVGYSIITETPVGKLVGVGYFLLPEYWAKGFATEAMKEVIRFAFEENNVFRIEAGCMKENIGSEKVMIKSGMIKEAEFKSCAWHDGKIKDRILYRLLKTEWDNYSK